ncbi:MAG: hypothetical protein B6U86_03755 [Candidatus Altiarchaeales archaeon ex4484_43]|nr:MAG: hypothetical protein B6U86_03755 [Candidatus Altiarchaeales archaeon ex4484_43]
MASKEDKILEILDDLLGLEDIHACVVAKRDMMGVIPDTKRFNPDVIDIWEILKDTTNKFFDYSVAGLDKVYFELRDHDVLFFILPGTDTALVSIVPALANRGLLEVEMENARRRIMEVI